MAFPVDIEFVQRTEKKLGRRLPAGYVARICRHNGGEVSAGGDRWRLHPIFDDSDKKRLKRTCNDIVGETATVSESWSEFPVGAVVIGANGAGDVLILLPDSQPDRFSDSVYWWDHETGQVNGVADSFAELVEVTT